MIMKITCIEIESPYRYRAYMVGKKPLYDIQNNTLFCQSDSIVISILKNTDDIGYTVYMSNGEHINIESGQLIVHQEQEDYLRKQEDNDSLQSGEHIKSVVLDLMKNDKMIE